MKFSSALPQDCPLPRAVECAREIYMLFPESKPQDEHCKSQAERNRARNARGEGVCTRHGLSVFPDYASCAHQFNLFPQIGRFVGKAQLGSSHGQIAETASGTNPKHMTWWPFENVNRASLFEIVGELECSGQ